MKRFILTVAALAFMGMACAQSPAAKYVMYGGKIVQDIIKARGPKDPMMIPPKVIPSGPPSITPICPIIPTPLTDTSITPSPIISTPLPDLAAPCIPGNRKGLVIPPHYKPSKDNANALASGLTPLFYHNQEFAAKLYYIGGDRDYALQVLTRFLSYVKIESQSTYVEDPDSFPMTEGQIRIANYIHDELKTICKGTKVEIKMSPDYYIYVKVPSNIKKKVPSVMFMAHMDVTPEANGEGIKPQVHYNYDGGDIVLGNGLVLSPNKPEGRHLKDLVGKTIITSDGSTLLGADCKTGCTILVSLIEQMVNDKKFKHGDVYFAFSQNEDIGKAAMRMDLSYFDRVPEILIDVDGDEYGTFSVANFTAEGRSYLFKGNLAHPSNGKENGYADARTAMAYFIGQLPPETHPSHSEGKQGYIHCSDITQLDNRQDVRITFRIRYFDKADGERYAQYLEQALNNTRKAYPTVEVDLEDVVLQYDNIANSMHPKAVEVIEKAVAKTGIAMEPVEIRAGTTAAMMVAKGLPGGPCLYSAQQNAHGVFEYCALEEMIDLIGFTKCIVTEVSNLK